MLILTKIILGNSVLAQTIDSDVANLESISGRPINVAELKKVLDDWNLPSSEFGMDYIVRVPNQVYARVAIYDGACQFNSDDSWRTGYGPFLGLDDEFFRTLQNFEMRLCARRVKETIEHSYVVADAKGTMEDTILRFAFECGYAESWIFPRFAFSSFIVGPLVLKESPHFSCDPEREHVPKSELAAETTKEASEFLYYERILGSRQYAHLYLKFARRFLDSRKRDFDLVYPEK